MTDTAEKLIADLRASVSTLEQQVASLSSTDLNIPPADFERRSRITAELITQALVKLDSVQISKDAAANALRNGDRKTSRQLSVLLARRKNISKQLDQLGTVIDKLTAQAKTRVENEADQATDNNKTGPADEAQTTANVKDQAVDKS